MKEGRASVSEYNARAAARPGKSTLARMLHRLFRRILHRSITDTSPGPVVLTFPPERATDAPRPLLDAGLPQGARAPLDGPQARPYPFPDPWPFPLP